MTYLDIHLIIATLTCPVKRYFRATTLIDRVGAYPHATCPRITLLPELEQVLHSL